MDARTFYLDMEKSGGKVGEFKHIIDQAQHMTFSNKVTCSFLQFCCQRTEEAAETYPSLPSECVTSQCHKMLHQCDRC